MKMLAKWLRFVREEHGSGSVFMILMLPPFLALAGLAIDASAAYRTRAVLQSAADAASLAAALALPDVNKAQADALTFANANVPSGYGTGVLSPADVIIGTWDSSARTFAPGGTRPNAVQIFARRTVSNGNPLPTTFLKLIGVDHWDVSAQAIATSSVPILRVSLALDNTGSMSDADATGTTKIAALKDASHKLLTLLENAAVNPGDVQVAIVPFTRDVKIGTGYSGSSWLSWTDFRAAPTTPATSYGPGTNCPWTDGSQGYHCQSSALNGSGRATKIPSSGLICPSLTATGHYWNGCFNSTATKWDKKGNATAWSHTWTANATSTWGGCVTDRNQDYDTTNMTPASGTPATMMVAENTPSCPAATVMPLSYDWTALNNKINSMVASGTTNQTIGLTWGWQALTQGDPFNPAPPPKNTAQIIILLSDGLNTQDRWYGDGSNHSTSVDNRMALACANAKAAGITIYTVYVDIAGATGNSAVLENCASSPSSAYYFDLTTTADIAKAFDTIGRRITALRLVH
jgi:Flp pilus assembly protein TadG